MDAQALCLEGDLVNLGWDTVGPRKMYFSIYAQETAALGTV